MKWSILILTLPARMFMLTRLLGILIPQLYGIKDIEIIVKTFDARYSLGENRELLRKMSSGEYLNFIDDDDLVAKDYVAKIYPLLDGVDYVSFGVQTWVDGEPSWKFDYSLTTPGPYKVDSQFRDISHLHPMRRDLAMMVELEGGRCEDMRWADRIRELKVVRTEHHLDESLYAYHYRTTKAEVQ